MVEHPRRRGLEHLPRRPVLQRLRRPHLLGRRDVDVPVAAGPAPDLAAGMDAYRFDRLPEAQQHASATGYQGARFPWESALDGTEQIPPPVSVNSEGLYEQHITADIALAQWQYYLATGDKTWLARPGLAGDLGAAALLGLAGDTRRRRQLRHRRRHRSRRGEPRRQRRGATPTPAPSTTLRTPSPPPQALGDRPPAAWSQIAAGPRCRRGHGARGSTRSTPVMAANWSSRPT